jgi:hypothetical protein
VTRRAMRRARELRVEWLGRLVGGEVEQAPFRGGATTNRGTDYADAGDRWVCNRKKAYQTRALAVRVATRMNAANEDERTAREGFFGVVVQEYACGRCGLYHIGR